MAGSSSAQAQVRIGDALTRVEDLRLVTGRGCYADDVEPALCLHAAMVRAPFAHARLLKLETEYARSAPGVVTVLTGADYAADGLGDLSCESMTARIAGTDWKTTPFPPLISEYSLCVGECVAMVVARSRSEAIDAAELIEMEWEELPALADMAAALMPDATPVHAGHADNFCFDVLHGDGPAVARAFADAAYVVAIKTVQPRVYAAPLEPRACIGSYDAGTGRLDLLSSLQNPHSARRLIAETIFGIGPAQLRVHVGDVGGSFGMKGRFYPEDVLVLWAARRLGRPVKWRADRSESFVADFHGRDQEAEGRLALDAEGRILALEVVTRHNVGARLGPATGVSPCLTPRMILGPYRIPAASIRAQAVFTHLRPTTSYRGAGRPEATYFIERLLDRAAHALDLSPVEIRRRNLIPPTALPYRTAMGDEYDCGDLSACLDKALELAELDGFTERRARSAEHGRLRGWGISTFIEVASISNERMELRFDPAGNACIIAGTCAHGQGHETMFRQMVSDWLGLPFGSIGFRQGDTDVISYGGGTYASRSMTAGGSALKMACDLIVERARAIAAWMLDCPEDTLTFDEGLFRADGNRSLTLTEVARASYRVHGLPARFGAGLEAVGYYQTERHNYPNGCHLVEVEIDRDTGEIWIDRYIAVDDVGRTLNPLLLEGQLQGSIAQGVGAAILETILHDRNGQLLTAAFTDYAMPRAHHAPRHLRMGHRNIPTATNPLGVKGGAEVGTIGAPPAVVQAVNNALGLAGSTALEMPLRPQDVLARIPLSYKEPL